MMIAFNEYDKQKLIDMIQRTVYKEVHICSIKKHTYLRSNNQNRYLWGVVYSVMAGEMGETTDVIHQICCQKFLSEVIEVGDEEYRVTKSTAKLDTAQFSAYVEQVRQWAWHEFQIVIPEAERVDEMLMNEIRERYNQGLQIRNTEEDDF